MLLASPMPSPQKKRDLADFFRPYAQHKILENTIPKKRPSPSLESELDSNTDRRGYGQSHDATPVKCPFKTEILSPVPLQSTPASVLRSGSLPFRSPNPQRIATPASVYKNGRLFKNEGKPHVADQKPSSPFLFSDLPISSRSTAPTSKAVVIKDSDDEDTDSLQSLDDIFGRKRDDELTSSSSPLEPDSAKLEAERVRTLDLFTRRPSKPIFGTQNLRLIHAKERAHRFDLSGILGDHFNDTETQSRIEKSRATYDASVQEMELSRQTQVNQSLLASLIHADGGGDEDIARLMGAMERTEAFSSDKSFTFFKFSGIVDWQRESPSKSEFPKSAIPQNLWQQKDIPSRTRAYLSGSVAELARTGSLDDDAMKWTFDSILSEQSDELRQAYIGVMQQGSSTWTRTCLTPQHVQDCFQILGANHDSLCDGITVPAKYQPLRKQPLRNPRFLLSILDLYQHVCQHMDFPALSKLVSVLCRLTVDGEVMTNGGVAAQVEQNIGKLLNLSDTETQLHVYERIVLDMGQYLHDPLLQSQLLSHILPISTTAIQLRIELAHIFLLGKDSTKKTDNISWQNTLELLTNHVSISPTFETVALVDDEPVDFTALRARTHILDTAISTGGRPSIFTNQVDENDFNKAVDDLADALKVRFVAIADTGATHMRRTEAKDAMQALYWRLLYSVRTRPRPKKHLFDKVTGKIRDGDQVRSEQRGKDFMKQFLAKREQKSRAKDIENSVDEFQSTPTSETEVLIRRQLDLN